MPYHYESRIMQNGNGWYWEIFHAGTYDVTARGLADTHAQARADVAKVLPEDVETWKAA